MSDEEIKFNKFTCKKCRKQFYNIDLYTTHAMEKHKLPLEKTYYACNVLREIV